MFLSFLLMPFNKALQRGKTVGETDPWFPERVMKHTPLGFAARGVSPPPRPRAAAPPPHRPPTRLPTLPKGTADRSASTLTPRLQSSRSCVRQCQKKAKREVTERQSMLKRSDALPQPLLPGLPASYPFFSFTLIFPLRYLAWRNTRFRPSFEAFQTQTFSVVLSEEEGGEKK